MYNRKQIEAIKIVQDLNRRRMCFIDDLFSGDKDTYAEAFDTIMRERGIDMEYWGDYDEDERRKYRELYKKEINIKFLELIEWGKQEIEFLESVEAHLEDLKEHVELNLNFNKFDFPFGRMEINTKGFDPNNN